MPRVSSPTLPRGIRNNNPLNIKHSASNWVGMSPEQTDPTFVQFQSAEYGIRAAAKILQGYQTKYALRSVAEIIGRWSATDQGPYIAHVSAAMGVSPNDPISLANPLTMQRMITAMIAFENGRQPYAAATISTGVLTALA